MIPWPRFAGKMYTKYFQLLSSNCRAVTRAFPKSMKKAPVRTSQTSLPQRDMTIPATRPPRGVASDGIASRAPALVAESSNTTWKKRGSMKRYCLELEAFPVKRNDLKSRHLPHRPLVPHKRSKSASTPATDPSASSVG